MSNDWPWSSYRATAAQVNPSPWLTTDWVLSGFGNDRREACETYREFVYLGKNQPSPWESLKNQIYLGSDSFIESMQCKINPDQSLLDIPKPQKHSPRKPLEYYQLNYARHVDGLQE